LVFYFEDKLAGLQLRVLTAFGLDKWGLFASMAIAFKKTRMVDPSHLPVQWGQSGQNIKLLPSLLRRLHGTLTKHTDNFGFATM